MGLYTMDDHQSKLNILKEALDGLPDYFNDISWELYKEYHPHLDEDVYFLRGVFSNNMRFEGRWCYGLTEEQIIDVAMLRKHLISAAYFILTEVEEHVSKVRADVLKRISDDG
jgi:hypothetical protein